MFHLHLPYLPLFVIPNVLVEWAFPFALQPITTNGDGTISTGTWVVDNKVAQQSAKYGAYVALHKVRSEVSYLQGALKDFRIKKRDRENADGEPVGIEYGIVFVLEPTNEPYQWNGDGSGEKGYQWSVIQ